MDPYLFCSTPREPHVLLTTFNLDLVFFERVVLNRLSAGGAELPIVIADRRQVDLSLAALKSPLRKLGRAYQIIDPPVSGAFHPKMILRLGEAGGQALVGSGNLSRGGWGFNKEAGSAWRLGPGTEDQGAWIRPILRSAQDWAAEELEKEKLQRMLDLPWVREANPGQSAPVLWSLNRPLAPQVAERWEGRRFDQMWVLTGSTDPHGRMIQWAVSTFGVQRVRVGITPERCSFEPGAIEAIEADIEFIPVERPPLHAKVFWLSGPDGDGAIVGSPNCSAAGWLVPPSAGGNVECALVHDEASFELFSEILHPLTFASVPLTDMVPDREEEEPDEGDADSTRVRIESARYDSRSGQVEVRLAGDATAPGASTLMDGNGLSLLLREVGDIWVGQVPPGTFRQGESKLVHVEIQQQGGDQIKTPPRWVSDHHALQGAGEGREVSDAANDLRRAVKSGDTDSLLEGLARINHLLFAEHAKVRDVLGGRHRKGTGDEGPEPVPQIAAENLLRSLEEVRVEKGSEHLSYRSMGGSLSTRLLLSLLFPAMDEEVEEDPEDTADASVHSQELDEEQKSQEESDVVADQEMVKGGRPSGSDRNPSKGLIEKKKREAQSKRHKRIMGGFLQKFGDRKALSGWDAEQLVNAISYFAAALWLGIQRDWVSSDQLRDYAFGICDELLGCEERVSVLSGVRDSYEAAGRVGDFYSIVGDGRIWSVLLVVLNQVRPETPGEALDLLVLLKRLLGEKSLIRFHVPKETVQLFHSMDVEAAKRESFRRCVQASRGLLLLEKQLEAIGKDILEIQEVAPPRHLVGDLFWSPVVGWAVALENGSPKRIRVHENRERGPKRIRPAGFFINVTAACRHDLGHDLQDAFTGLQSALSDLLGSIDSLDVPPSTSPPVRFV